LAVYEQRLTSFCSESTSSTAGTSPSRRRTARPSSSTRRRPSSGFSLPAYNVHKYARYPRSSDGPYGSGLTRYGYSVGQDPTLLTPSGHFRGRRDDGPTHAQIGQDLIVVEGEDVRLIRPPDPTSDDPPSRQP